MDKKTTQFLINVGKSAPRNLVKAAVKGDQKAAVEMNKFWGAKIDKAVRLGQIPKADPSDFNKFVKDHSGK